MADKENEYLNLRGLEEYHKNMKTALDKKVDKVSGKGLSSNDYTSTDKTRVTNLYNYVYTQGTALNAGDDINNCTGIGKWYSVDASRSATLKNTPWTSTGFCLINVLITGTTNYIQQFLLPSTDSAAYVLYKRRYRTATTDPPWGDWARVTGADATTSLSGLMSAADKGRLNDLYDYVIDHGTALKSGDDLNNCTGAGKWYSGSAATSATIQNTPYTGAAFTVINILGITDDRYRQFLIPNSGGSSQVMYSRHYGSSGWSDWTRLTGADATTSLSGLMSAADKTKLNGITEGANKYTHPTYTAKNAGLYKVTVTNEGHVSAATAVTKADITGLGIASNDVASTSANGLMSSADKGRVDMLYDYIRSIGTPLSNGDDLDDCTGFGRWYSANGTMSATLKNTPHTAAGFALINIPITDSTTYFTQFLISNSSSAAYALYCRRHNANGWNPWARLTGADATTSLSGLMSATDKGRLNDLYDYVLTRGTELKAGDDLDKLITVGRWYSLSATVSAGLINTPYTASGFGLINVVVNNTATYIQQFLLPSNDSASQILYKRRWRTATDGWGDWVRVTGADATTTLSGLMSAADKKKLNAIPEDIQEQVTETVHRGAKNYLMNNFTTTTTNGITATSNPDGSITLNGTSTSSGAFIMCWNLQTGATTSTNSMQYANNQKWIPNGDYILSGGINNKASIQVRMASEPNNEGTGKAAFGTEVSLTVTDEHKYVWARVYISAGASFANEKVYPMIRPATVKDPTYVPYAKTNQQLSYKKYYTATREPTSFNPAITTALETLTPGIDIFVDMSMYKNLSYDGTISAVLYTTLLDGTIVSMDIYIDDNMPLPLGLLEPGVLHLVFDGAKWKVADKLPNVKYPYATAGAAISANNIILTNATGQLVPKSSAFDPTQPIYFNTKSATSGAFVQYAMITKMKGIQSTGYMASGQTPRNGPQYVKVQPSSTKGLWTISDVNEFYTDLSKVSAGGYYMKLLNRYDDLSYSFELTEDHPVFLVQSDIIARVL